MAALYHIAPRADWERARARGVYDYDALATDGFIHCCHEDQIAGVAETWFRGRSDLVLLAIDPDRLDAELRIEGGFPHVYGPIAIDAITAVTPLDAGAGSA